MRVKNFALVGAAGYIAPRHFKAIQQTGNRLTAILDKSDSVGIIDSYFPDAAFFTESERFDRHLYRCFREHSAANIDYVSICSPNYLHDAHIRMALRNGAHAICEKPLVLNPWNLEGLEKIETETGNSIFHILQLRLHPAIIELKSLIDQQPDKIYNIDLTYITGRGTWYLYSWKADMEKSGGITTNIGSHFFDMLTYVFGDVQDIKIHYASPLTVSGFLQLKKARVRWFLSIDKKQLPQEVAEKGKTSYRSLTIDNQEFDFSDGFTDLHTLSYQNILSGNGFRIRDAYPYVTLCHDIRSRQPEGLKGDYHPYVAKSLR
ncbi:MAG: Gfo/Idh/MocA family oxidoreductase [Lentimicrobiaceae bacterium]|nr:Gfo/Idh/MocA family oxidoreductase [Lentimicrobiaceae bacterium]